MGLDFIAKCQVNYKLSLANIQFKKNIFFSIDAVPFIHQIFRKLEENRTHSKQYTCYNSNIKPLQLPRKGELKLLFATPAMSTSSQQELLRNLAVDCVSIFTPDVRAEVCFESLNLAAFFLAYILCEL